jgi:hypothetical protein
MQAETDQGSKHRLGTHVCGVVRFQVPALKWPVLCRDGRVVAGERDRELLKEFKEEIARDISGVCVERDGPIANGVHVVHGEVHVEDAQRSGY